MSDLISREMIMGEIRGWQEDIRDNEYDANRYDFVFDRIYEIIDEISTVDAEPVVHAHWVREPTETFGSTDYDYHCSACKSYPVKDVLTKRCPVCGAIMDEVSE